MTRTSPALLAAILWSCGTSHQTPDSDAGDTEADTLVADNDTALVDTRDDVAEPPDVDPDPALANLHAPDEYSVTFVLRGQAGADWLVETDRYMVVTERERLLVRAVTVSREGDDARVTLETPRQRLGLTYSVEVYGDEDSPYLTGDFVAADTAVFWVYDWRDASEVSQFALVAERVALGEHSVAYVQQGQRLDNVEAILSEFDAHIYPTETSALIAAPDLDDNGRVVILGLPGYGYFGGYFDPVNAMLDSETMAMWDYHSNEMEIVHLATDTPIEGHTTLAHEFQHLLYHERHGFVEPWDYHNEGLAEVAVQMVYGRNDVATEYLLSDYDGRIANGLSMVHWTYALYENYVLAYTFLTYLGAQSGDPVAMYRQIFDLPTGAPEELDALLFRELGASFADLHLDAWIALWLQQATGPYSYEGLATFSRRPPTVPSGVESLDLEPFGAGLFVLDADRVLPPRSVGAHIRYVGINAEGEVDLRQPYDVEGGVLIAYNSNPSYADWRAEHSGPDLPALSPAPTPMPRPTMSLPPQRWQNPPPRDPNHPEVWRRWLDAREAWLR